MYKAMERGEVSSDKILPIVGKLMKASAASGIDAARTSSIAEQARAENAQIALLDTFSKNGGEAGFARFWRTIAWAMKELEPLVKGMAGLFERLSVIMQAPVRLFGMLGTAVGYLNQQFGWSEKNIVTFAALGALMFTKWGKIGAVFTTIAIAIEDLAFGLTGRDSLTKRAMDGLHQLTGFTVDQTKGIFAVAGAFGTIAAGLWAIEKAKKSLPEFVRKTPPTPPGGKPSIPGSPNIKNPLTLRSSFIPFTMTSALDGAISGEGATFGRYQKSLAAATMGLALYTGAVTPPLGLALATYGGALYLDAMTGGGIREGIKTADKVYTGGMVSPTASRADYQRMWAMGQGDLATMVGMDDLISAERARSATGSPITIQQGAIQINVESNDPERIATEAKGAIESLIQNA